MASQRKGGIAWTDETWNPVTGCTKVSSGCKFCYAERDFHRPYPGRAFTDVRMHRDRLEQPRHWKRPRRIFVNSMSDLFHEAVTDDFLTQCFGVMALAHWHTFQVLTKRPQRMKDHLMSDRALCTWPLPNVWLGVSVEDRRNKERIDLLRQVPAAIRFLSLEPLLEDIGELNLDRIHWVIAGSESGPGARPANVEWYRSVRDQCVAANVPFFLKQFVQNGKKVSTPELDGVRWTQCPAQI